MIEEYLDLYRFNPEFEELEIKALHYYFYQLFMTRGTSEYALFKLFND